MSSLCSKDSSRLHLNMPDDQALAFEHFYNPLNGNLQRGSLQRAIYDGCTGCHGGVDVAFEGLEKAVSVVEQRVAVEDAGVVKNDCKFVGSHGSAHGLI